MARRSMGRLARLTVALLLAASAARLPAAEPPLAPAPAPGKSLLFAPADASAISKAIADFERTKTTGVVAEDVRPPDVPNIYVSALAYYGEGEWTVWANGYRIVPNRQPPDFTVISVTQDSAEISVSGSHPARFVLHPYQTWLSQSDDVVEGIFP